ncbi:MAG: alkaline phosphatase family protein [Deltaproteobacteria bacterium]|nr:alkaline phosphatase family protein [Deltaproteobacteria bacterium]
MSVRRRVLVIGLDGAPFPLLRQWAEAGHLPTLRRLFAEGSAGVLGSTMPPTSGPAWSSFATGKNPGKTGIYDFLYRRAGGYVFPPVNTTMRSGASLWRLLSDAGLKVGVVNLPISYPVEEVDGVFISGWMTPYFATDYTWPAGLGEELRTRVGDYRIYPAETFSERGAEGFFRAADELLDLLTRTTLYLMERNDWDFFMTVYFDVDRILHQLWHYLDDDHPWRRGDRRDGATLAAPVLRYFQRLDADIARVIAKAGEGTSVLLMSDHGMGRASRFVVLNNLLLELGLMKLDSDLPTRLKAFALRRGLTLRNVHRLADRLGLAKHAEYKNVYSFDGVLKRFFLSFLNVDWERTRAYSYGRHYGSLFLNVKGREPRGMIEPAAYERTRDEIAEAVLAYRDPELGRPLVSRVIRREEVYRGARFEEAPDLILLPWDDADIFYGLSDFGSSRIWDETYRYSGMHRDNGVLAACGGAIARGTAPARASIVDVAPTVLHLLGQPVPDDMDGRVLEELLDADFLAANPVQRRAVTDHGSGADQAMPQRDYSAEEEAEVLERLRDLGYLN